MEQLSDGIYESGAFPDDVELCGDDEPECDKYRYCRAVFCRESDCVFADGLSAACTVSVGQSMEKNGRLQSAGYICAGMPADSDEERKPGHRHFSFEDDWRDSGIWDL